MVTKNQLIAHLRAKNKELEDNIEAVREFVLSRRADIEKDLENFGVLRPVLSYFLEEARDDG